mmetsp:Transcript_36267/g.71278  ORF Transcript_36267/g.71278 Transcript_36267/m.71278 type:complete len:244 (+) Transcript_36267:734-1465(+)
MSNMAGNWEVETHHIFFVPEKMTPPMPSGNKFSRVIITLEAKLNASHYLWNGMFIFLLIPFSFVPAIVDSDQLLDRVMVTLTIVLALAAYKINLTTWIPQKPYLTFIDGYVIISFLSSFVAAGLFTVNGFRHFHNGVDKKSSPKWEWVVGACFCGLWSLLHLCIICLHLCNRENQTEKLKEREEKETRCCRCRNFLYLSRAGAIKQETHQIEDNCKLLEAQNKLLSSIKPTSKPPEPPKEEGA